MDRRYDGIVKIREFTGKRDLRNIAFSRVGGQGGEYGNWDGHWNGYRHRDRNGDWNRHGNRYGNWNRHRNRHRNGDGHGDRNRHRNRNGDGDGDRDRNRSRDRDRHRNGDGHGRDGANPLELLCHATRTGLQGMGIGSVLRRTLVKYCVGVRGPGRGSLDPMRRRSPELPGDNNR